MKSKIIFSIITVLFIVSLKAQSPDTLWTKCYGGTASDNSYSIQQTSNGDYIIAGFTESNDGDVSGNHGDKDVWVVKIDEMGDTIWTKTYGGSKMIKPNVFN